MSLTWEELRESLDISEEEECLISLEKDLIRTMVKIREEKGLTQAQLADLCEIKQSALARLESAVHFPRIDTMIKVLAPLGYTLRIMPLDKRKR